MKRKFYKSNLSSVVWDPEEGKPLARFEGGSFTTEDESVAKILENMGYPEVDLEAETPPAIPDPPIQPLKSPDVRVMGKQVTEETVISKGKRDAMMEKDPDDRKANAGVDGGAGKGESADKPKREIKRRTKD